MAATLLTAYATVLQHWSGDQRFTLNIPRFNRQPLHPQVNRVVGEFASFTLLGVDWQSDLPFGRRVEQIQQSMLQAISRDRISGVEVLRMRNELKGGVATMPFVFTNAPEQQGEDGEKQSFLDALEQLGPLQYAISQTPQVWIDCQYHESLRGLYLFWDVRQGVFPQGMTDQMFDAYITLLTDLVDGQLDEDQPIQLAAIAPIEETAKFEEIETSGNNRIWQRFLACAQREPEADVVIAPSLSFSWQQLLQYSLALAGELASVTKPGQRVLLLVEKGPWQSVAVLAGIHQGLTMVPLDIAAPLARQQFIAEDTTAVAVIYTSAQLQVAQALGIAALNTEVAQRVELDSMTVELVTQPAPETLLTIYTSGSTGEPKGVDVPYDGLLNAVDYTLQRFCIAQQDRLFALTQLQHDMAWFDLLAMCSAGVTLVYPSSSHYRDPAHWLVLLKKHQITLWNSVPQLLEMLLRQLMTTNKSVLVRPRLAFVGGDWLALNLPVRMKEALPNCQLVSVGGPTETTLWNIMYPVTQVGDDWQSIPYGYPIANNSYRILDVKGLDCPIGVTGELCCSGVGVSIGYLNRPELNAEKFVVDETGTRMFRTGDQGRYRHDGSIEFMGRNDQQLMVGGYRIEPQEVVRQLCAIKGVEAAELALLEGQLVAWLVVPQGGLPPLPELRAQLAQWLPQQMLPQRFYRLKALPLTANGKVNRTELENQLDQPLQANGSDQSPLIGNRQQQVADCWQQVLGRRPNCADADFFQQGGHSLAAVRLYGLLWPQGHSQYSVISLFEHRTVTEQAALLAQTFEVAPVDQLRALHQQQAPLTSIQLGILFSEQLTPDIPVYNLPFRIRMNETVNLQRAEDALSQAFCRHKLFNAVVGDDNQWHYQSQLPTNIQISLKAQPDAAVLKLAHEQASTVFDLRNGPLWCAHLLNHQDGHKELLLTVHHLVFDGWSLALLLEDWQAYYQLLQLKSQTSQPLPSLAAPVLQFFDYAIWAQQQPENLADADYWQQQLSDYQSLALPTDFERPARQSFQVESCIRMIDSATLHQLQELASRYKTTLFVVLASSWMLLLSRYADQDDLVIGTHIARRDQPLLQQLPGMLLNNLVLRAKLQPQMRFSELLEQQRDSNQDAFAHAGLPFEQLVRVLGEQRDGSRHPIYQATIVVDNSAINDLQSDNPMGLELLPACQAYGHMDIELNVQRLGRQMRASFVYSTDLFERRTIEQLAEQFTRLLSQILLAPEQPLSKFEFNTSEHRQQLQLLGRGREVDLPEQRLVDYWQQIVTRKGDAVAVIEGDQQISFQALADSARQLAAELLQNGVLPASVVAVHLPLGINSVRALLALIQLGCCYMPLQPDLPLLRKQKMLRQSGCQHLIGEVLSVEGLSCHSAQVLNSCAPLAVNYRSSKSAANRSLYIVFTSGSTGEPKVISANEQATLNRLQWGWRQMPLTADDRGALKTAAGFVDSIQETLGPLLQGCPLVTISYLDQLQPERMLAQFAVHRITCLLMVPSLMENLLHWCEQAPERYISLLPLNWLTLSGESLNPALARLLQQRLPNTCISNLYGSAEVGADVLSYRLPSATTSPTLAKDKIPLGLPLDNCSVELRDSWGGLTPLGGKGELVITGLQVVSGYLRNPGHPQFSQQDDTFYFHSRDLARLDVNSQFCFLGRVDNTVKIRGQRLALGDVKQALLNCDGVVAASTQLLDGSVLGVQVVLQAGSKLVEVQRELRQQLPSWMVPSRWLQSDQLPLLSSGKINQRQVCQLLQHSPEIELKDCQQWTPTEQQLAILWQQLTEQSVQHHQQSFFDTGGHSLLLTRLLHSINREFQLSIDISSLYNSLELASMSSLIDVLKGTELASYSIEEEGVL